MKKPEYPHKIRIISGTHRGRKIPILSRPDLRPSPVRVRETLFSWLQNAIAGAEVLDAFAGSGAMGLEALSRGATHVLFCDQDPIALKAINTLLKTWEIPHAQCLQGDALSLKTARNYDLILLDPPFQAELQQQLIHKFANDHWLKPHGKIYLESPIALESFSLNESWQWIKKSRAGQVHFGLIGKKDD